MPLFVFECWGWREGEGKTYGDIFWSHMAPVWSLYLHVVYLLQEICGYA